MRNIMIRKCLPTLLLIFAPLASALSETSLPPDIQARVYYDSIEKVRRLAALDLDIVGVERQYLDILAYPDEIAALQAQGFRTEIIHESATAFYSSRLSGTASPADMGGYKTLSEIIAALDIIISDHPSIISPRQSLGTTHEGRDIWAVKISDNPTVDESEPEVLFTGAIHAREVITPEVLLAYMDFLTNGYGVDPEATELVNEREIWFVPVVNPDGYYYNQVIAPFGGGMWRKNRRDNGGGVYGVDLNRNFAFGWGWDDIGSSPYTGSESYRGPAAFSEPETQALRDFEISREFVLSCYYHSYSDIFIYPYGFTTELPPDNDIYRYMGDTVNAMNGYRHGQPWMLLYPTNGGACDWEYGDQTSKDKVFGFTIEIGTIYDYFWPPLDRVPELIAENMEPIKFLTRIAGNIYALRPPVAPVVDVPPLVVGAAYSVAWTHSDQDNPAVAYELKELRYPHLMVDPADAFDNWMTSGFSLATDRSYSPPSSFASGTRDTMITWLQSAYPLTVEAGDTLRLMTWYDIHFYYDFAYVQVSTNRIDFTSLPGNITSDFNPYGTNRGNGITGTSGDWIQALFDLSAYAGQQIWIRFVYETDFSTHGAGFFVDDIYPQLVFDDEQVVAGDLVDLSYDFTDRPLGVYYYQARARDAQNQWSDYSPPIRTNVLAPGKGDPDLDGVKGSVADLALFYLYQQYGLPAFELYQSLQIGQTDFDCDELQLSINDVNTLAEILLGQTIPCYAGGGYFGAAESGARPIDRSPSALSGDTLSFAVQLQATSFETGDSAWVDVVLTEGNASLLGFQFHLEYDTSGMSLADVRFGDALSGWDNIAHSESIIGTTADLHVAGVAWSEGTAPSPADLEPGPLPKTLVRMKVLFDSEASLSRDFRFVWQDCFDNTLAAGGYAGENIALERLTLSRAVLDADLAEITGAALYGGADYTCAYGLFGATPTASVDFTSGRVFYDASCCQGVTGDVNGEGGDEPTIGDVSSLIDFLFIEGTVPACLAEADVNQSGGAYPPAEEITIGDISTLIDHLFISEDPLPACL